MREHAPTTTVTHWARALLAQLPDDHARSVVLARAGVDVSLLDSTDLRLVYDAAVQICGAAAEAMGDPDAGLHFAERLDTSAIGVVGYFAAASDTLDAALQRVIAYHRLLKDPGQVEISRDDEGVTVVELPPPGSGPWPRHFAESVIAAYVTMPRVWTGRPITPRAVTFQHAEPTSTAEHERIFGLKPVFDAPVNSITLTHETLARSLPTGDASLARYLRIAADHELAALPQQEALVTDLERAILAALPDGPPSIQRIARALGMSARTLQRRLSERGKCFQDEVDRVRCSAAQRLLDDERLTIAEVAFLLGFSDPSGFQRAHRRWTGLPPRRRPTSDRPPAS